ncbi:conserved hypothetical protein [Perkinsus marinus ATCC 50983]|uniref:Uncharacterized protein n=1 Tax=Perkinsus marinus (strain ATCC 50983 / TXsc) TaxID=423536 RepID=C5KYT4_PERM5|nr:conserved hypothetical protein [Perkinsus marinus ATCC 50983]EER10362.1 conserved hypothetical protein [Perkinsus marinus ATCC 50983]|eukprot:XP_002778567.1 conserved hypothetical protein [Perkinsus marinus ATCC 50983]
MVKSSYANTQSFDEWMQGKNLSTTGGSQRGRSLDRTLRSITTPDDFATTAMARMRSHMARLEKQKASFMDNEARRERARSRSAQRKKERDELIYQRMMEMLDKERRQQMCFRPKLRRSRVAIRYRQRMEQLAEATKRMRDAKRGDRFKRNKDMQEHNRDQLLQVRKDREMRLSEALAARAESRRAKRAALLSAERSRLARLREKVKEDERRKMALTEEMRAKDTRSKDQLHRNKMEFEAFVQETHRKRAISEHLVERRRRREQYLKDAEADRQVLEAACDIEMERMTLAMKRQRVEYDRRKFQTNFEAAKKDERPKSAASLTSLLPSINHHSVLPRSTQWSLAPRLSTPRGYDSGLGPGSYDIPSTLGADQIGPRWAPDSVDRSELAERPVRYEPPPPSSPPRSPSMSPILRPVRGNDGPGPGHRHEPVSVHRLPRPRDPKTIAEHFRVLVESGRHYLSMVSQTRVSAASVANDPGSIFRSRHSTSCRRSLSSLRSSSSRGRLDDDEPDQAPTELAVPKSATPATEIREGAEDSSVEPTEMAGNGAARNGTAISSKEEEEEEYESDFVEE